jgi:hypothetical protein
MIPPTPETKETGTRRVRKVVNKTFVDDQGFTVTKRELESCSEEDEEEKPVAVLASSKKTNAAAPAKAVVKEPAAGKKAPAKKKPAASPQKAKQATIMNFFKKQ